MNHPFSMYPVEKNAVFPAMVRIHKVFDEEASGFNTVC